MRSLLSSILALIVLLLILPAAVAQADAIMPFDGECPPGLRVGVRNHSEACIPRTCVADTDCGAGASCVTLCTCRAPREFRSRGRRLLPEPVTEVVEVGLCDASGACDEGEVAERKQCEPDAATPAFDPRRHVWTGESHPTSPPAEAPGSQPTTEGQAAETPPAAEEPSEQPTGSGGCAAVGLGGERGSGAALGLLVAALVFGRRRRRAR